MFCGRAVTLWLLVIACASLIAAFPCQALTDADALTKGLSGTWEIDILDPDMGWLQTRMTFALDGEKIAGHSYDGGASVVASWFERAAANITSSIFEHGALLHITKITAGEKSEADRKLLEVHGNTVPFRAMYSTAAGAALLRATVIGDTVTGMLLRNGFIAGWLYGTRAPRAKFADYPTVMALALDTMRKHLYDPSFEKSSAYEDFAEALTELGNEAREDAEVVMKAYRIRNRLPFSHCYLYRQQLEHVPYLYDADVANVEPQDPTLDTSHANACVVTIPSFSDDGTILDSIMHIVQTLNRPNLILDLRGNSGGNVSATLLAKHFTHERKVVGTFITRRFEGDRTQPLSITAIMASTALSAQLPELETTSADTLTTHLRTGSGLRLVTTGGERVYAGRTTILTSGSTASTCEPLVYALKSWCKARVVGERTAGAMLSAESFALFDGWTLIVPTADYYTHDGMRLDKVGVEPDVTVDARSALKYALEHP